MHRCNSYVDSEWVSMCHWNLWLIDINTFNLRTLIFTVTCKTFPSIRTFTFLNTSSNEWTEEFFSFRERFNWGGSWKKANIFVLVILKKGLVSKKFSEKRLNLHQYSLVWEVSLGDELQYVKPQVWLDQIWSESLQDILFVSSSFFIKWSWYWIYPVDFDDNLFHQVHLELW